MTVPAALASVGGLFAAALLGGLLIRRRLQLQTRPVGRRIPHPGPPARLVEATLGRRARPASLRTLDLATRAIGAYCRSTRTPLPALAFATVEDEAVTLHWTSPAPEPPVGFTGSGSAWRLAADDVQYLRSVPGVDEAVRPYPAMVTLGLDEAHGPVVGDLEALGLLAVDGADAEVRTSLLLAMAVELSFSPWADEMILTLVGHADRLPTALGKHNVSSTTDVDGLLARLESRAREQHGQQPADSPRDRRLDPDLADPWAPEIVLVSQSLEPEQQRRLTDLVNVTPQPTLAVVLAGDGATARWTLSIGSEGLSGSAGAAATLQPAGVRVVPQLLPPPAGDAVLDLLTTTAEERTTPAPWWTDPDPEPPPDNVAYLGRRFGGWTVEHDGEEAGVDIDLEAALLAADAVHPILRILGPVDLVGARGPVPPRAAKQCLEYCGWLLENPGSTARAMATSLAVAEGTRRSNMSRLRSWLGAAPDGQPYLPDAYTGRIRLHSAVSSDWHRLQILTGQGVNRAESNALRAALELVRGAPLADAAPGQWHWAEELRTDMISAVRDVGMELAARALTHNDIELARWSASRALVAAPGDELLVVARIRTEHQAGNRAEVERLTLQLAGQARQLGVDLDPDTVTVLQQVMEGRVRARLA